jgi:hypothetical protein
MSRRRRGSRGTAPVWAAMWTAANGRATSRPRDGAARASPARDEARTPAPFVTDAPPARDERVTELGSVYGSVAPGPPSTAWVGPVVVGIPATAVRMIGADRAAEPRKSLRIRPPRPSVGPAIGGPEGPVRSPEASAAIPPAAEVTPRREGEAVPAGGTLSRDVPRGVGGEPQGPTALAARARLRQTRPGPGLPRRGSLGDEPWGRPRGGRRRQNVREGGAARATARLEARVGRGPKGEGGSAQPARRSRRRHRSRRRGSRIGLGRTRCRSGHRSGGRRGDGGRGDVLHDGERAPAADAGPLEHTGRPLGEPGLGPAVRARTLHDPPEAVLAAPH